MAWNRWSFVFQCINEGMLSPMDRPLASLWRSWSTAVFRMNWTMSGHDEIRWKGRNGLNRSNGKRDGRIHNLQHCPALFTALKMSIDNKLNNNNTV